MVQRASSSRKVRNSTVTNTSSHGSSSSSVVSSTPPPPQHREDSPSTVTHGPRNSSGTNSSYYPFIAAIYFAASTNLQVALIVLKHWAVLALYWALSWSFWIALFLSSSSSRGSGIKNGANNSKPNPNSNSIDGVAVGKLTLMTSLILQVLCGFFTYSSLYCRQFAIGLLLTCCAYLWLLRAQAMSSCPRGGLGRRGDVVVGGRKFISTFLVACYVFGATCQFLELSVNDTDYWPHVVLLFGYLGVWAPGVLHWGRLGDTTEETRSSEGEAATRNLDSNSRTSPTPPTLRGAVEFAWSCQLGGQGTGRRRAIVQVYLLFAFLLLSQGLIAPTSSRWLWVTEFLPSSSSSGNKVLSPLATTHGDHPEDHHHHHPEAEFYHGGGQHDHGHGWAVPWPWQTSWLPGRNKTEGFSLLRDLIHNINIKKREKQLSARTQKNKNKSSNSGYQNQGSSKESSNNMKKKENTKSEDILDLSGIFFCVMPVGHPVIRWAGGIHTLVVVEGRAWESTPGVSSTTIPGTLWINGTNPRKTLGGKKLSWIEYLWGPGRNDIRGFDVRLDPRPWHHCTAVPSAVDLLYQAHVATNNENGEATSATLNPTGRSLRGGSSRKTKEDDGSGGSGDGDHNDDAAEEEKVWRQHLHRFIDSNVADFVDRYPYYTFFLRPSNCHNLVREVLSMVGTGISPATLTTPDVTTRSLILAALLLILMREWDRVGYLVRCLRLLVLELMPK